MDHLFTVIRKKNPKQIAITNFTCNNFFQSEKKAKQNHFLTSNSIADIQRIFKNKVHLTNS